MVVAVENYGAGDLLEVELPDGKRSLIPFRPGIADLDGSESSSTPNSWPSVERPERATSGTPRPRLRHQAIAHRG